MEPAIYHRVMFWLHLASSLVGDLVEVAAGVNGECCVQVARWAMVRASSFPTVHWSGSRTRLATQAASKHALVPCRARYATAPLCPAPTSTRIAKLLDSSNVSFENSAQLISGEKQWRFRQRRNETSKTRLFGQNAILGRMFFSNVNPFLEMS